MSVLAETCALPEFAEPLGAAPRYGVSDEARREQLIDVVRAAWSAQEADRSAVEDEMQDYLTTLAFTAVIPLVIAVLFLLCCWPTCFIGRCCAHRCWKPHYGTYSTSKKMHAVAAYAVVFCIVLVMIILSALAASNVGHDARRTVCAVHEVALDVSNELGTTVAAVAGSIANMHRVAVSVAHALVDLSSLTVQITTAMGGACTATNNALASVNIINSIVPAGMRPAAYNSASEMLTSATSGFCDLSGLSTGAESAQRGLQDFARVLESGEDISHSAELIMNQTNDATHELDVALSEQFYPLVFETLAPLLDNLWLLVCALAMLVLLFSLCGTGCLQARHSPRACSTNQCGVQCLGCSWVCGTILVVPYLVLCALLLPVAGGLSDAVTLVRTFPNDPTAILGADLCNVTSNDNYTVNLCSVIESCNEPNSSIVEAFMGTNPFDEASARREAESIMAELVDVQTENARFNESNHNVSLSIIEFGTLSAASFGMPPGSPHVESINTELSYISGNLTIATNTAAQVLAQSAVVMSEMANLVVAAVDLAAELANVFNSIGCEIFPRSIETLTEPVGHLAEVGIGGLATTSALIATALALLALPAIIMQIRLGEVGREPGCPPCCHCCKCCCPAAKPAGEVKAVNVMKQEVQADTSAGTIGI